MRHQRSIIALTARLTCTFFCFEKRIKIENITRNCKTFRETGSRQTRGEKHQTCQPKGNHNRRESVLTETHRRVDTVCRPRQSGAVKGHLSTLRKGWIKTPKKVGDKLSPVWRWAIPLSPLIEIPFILHAALVILTQPGRFQPRRWYERLTRSLPRRPEIVPTPARDDAPRDCIRSLCVDETYCGWNSEE